MIVKVVRYNNKREVIKVDRYSAREIRLQPAGLVEIKGYGDILDVTYLKYFPGDPLDIYIEESDASRVDKV